MPFSSHAVWDVERSRPRTQDTKCKCAKGTVSARQIVPRPVRFLPPKYFPQIPKTCSRKETKTHEIVPAYIKEKKTRIKRAKIEALFYLSPYTSAIGIRQYPYICVLRRQKINWLVELLKSWFNISRWALCAVPEPSTPLRSELKYLRGRLSDEVDWKLEVEGWRGGVGGLKGCMLLFLTA